MSGIARKSAPIHAIVYYPETEEGRRELAQRAAGVHAEVVDRYIQNLDCPTEQKLKLLDSVIAWAKRGTDVHDLDGTAADFFGVSHDLQ